MMRAVRVATLVGALIVTITGCADDDESVDAEPVAAQAEASEKPADRGNRAVTFEAPGAPRPTVLTTNCNPADAGDCILPTNYPPTEVTGDLRGTAFSSTAVIGRNGVYPGASLNVFIGDVEGCGTGGLLLTNVGTFDPSSGLTTGEWTVNEDGGTGELADVSGGGTMVFDATGGRFEGRLRCR